MTNQEYEAEIARLNAKLNQNRCHSGHETLPLVLWDCPECHNITRRDRDAARQEVARLTVEVERLTAAIGARSTARIAGADAA